MQLEGSCHCKAVTFQLESPHPYPYQRCYCSICRKTAGSGGHAINLAGDAGTLKVEGREHISIYHAVIDGVESPAERHFCKHCGSALWLYDARWPELIHPQAGAIDTPLPVPPEHVHIMLDSKANWVEVAHEARDAHHAEYPDESIAAWHARIAERGTQ
ncbi:MULTISPECIES: GFA family protein [Cobetia]|uniref:GFA family protein n=1 Tax=Cobetia TaxID=204286 RepID=UPI0008661FBE|nr:MULTISPECIES: GFA family protein [Cobetia]AOM00973.1 alanine acetyltransferase [Cobetia marina]AZV30978.1 GFA family protein [Cobetia sp. ICG0124]MDH2375375.1 GFA family protein [Cobetia sp. 3AK]MDN2657881.1 GFA family protein [Cobetia sp. 14N.309.X.WAT.E.A4]POR07086.1 alanine acetyltransferase [Cobetia sp. MM1IDA2H-1]